MRSWWTRAIIALAAVLSPMSSAFAVSPSLVEARVVSEEGGDLFACGDMKPEDICMYTWFQWTIQIQRTLSGPPITGRIATAHIQHGSYVKGALKQFRHFVLTPIEDAQTRRLLKADYYNVWTACPPDTGNPDMDAILNEKCPKQFRSSSSEWRCDLLVNGERFDETDAKAAEEACRRAIRKFPDEVRFKAYLGYALYRLNRFDEASVLYRQAAEKGNSFAQASLGFMYDNGQGVPQNYTEALKWYRLAADQGDAFAQNDLGEFYYFGHGVAKSYTEALKWYRLAADRGSSTSQYRLGYMYQHGEGLPQSNTEAVYFYRRAAEQGDQDAQKALQRLDQTSP
jgi:tetratricopeptide (TPR) repeat protein